MGGGGSKGKSDAEKALDSQPNWQDEQKWKKILSVDEARTKYEKDAFMPRNFDNAMLELRLFLEDPNLIRCLANFARKTKWVNLFLCWVDIEELKTYEAQDKKAQALGLYDRYVKSTDDFNVGFEDFENEILDQIHIAQSTDLHEIAPGLFDELQKHCFTGIFDNVFKTYRESNKCQEAMKQMKKYNEVVPDDFWYMEKLGAGGFGMVVHGQKKSTGVHYAIKIQSKKGLLECFFDCPHRVDYEKQAMAKCNHPFIIGLDYSFQTATTCIMVMELGRAGTLRDHLDKCDCRRMPEARVRYYAAEIVLALSHMHKLGFMYRDLKPENILLSAAGHIKLVDLGGVVDPKEALLTNSMDDLHSALFGNEEGVMAEPSGRVGPSEYNKASSMRAQSVMGTRGYLAPEMLIMIEDGDDYEPRAGYSKSVDWWSLGITIYELLAGKNPFANADVVGFMSYVAEEGAAPVTEAPPEYAQFFDHLKQIEPKLSGNIIDIISQFLHVDSKLRLGSGTGGVRNIKSHKLFEGIDWSALHNMKIPTPFVPACPPVNTKPSYESYQAMMSQIGKPAWLVPFRSGRYYNNWDYISPHTLKMEMRLGFDMTDVAQNENTERAKG